MSCEIGLKLIEIPGRNWVKSYFQLIFYCFIPMVFSNVFQIGFTGERQNKNCIIRPPTSMSAEKLIDSWTCNSQRSAKEQIQMRWVGFYSGEFWWNGESLFTLCVNETTKLFLISDYIFVVKGRTRKVILKFVKCANLLKSFLYSKNINYNGNSREM